MVVPSAFVTNNIFKNKQPTEPGMCLCLKKMCKYNLKNQVVHLLKDQLSVVLRAMCVTVLVALVGDRHILAICAFLQIFPQCYILHHHVYCRARDWVEFFFFGSIIAFMTVGFSVLFTQRFDSKNEVAQSNNTPAKLHTEIMITFFLTLLVQVLNYIYIQKSICNIKQTNGGLCVERENEENGKERY